MFALVTGSPAAQPQLDTSRREALEADISDYQRLLESRAREARGIEAALAATSENLEARIAERDLVSEQLAELRSREQELLARITELEGQLAATEEQIAAINADLETLKTRVSALLINLHRQRTGRFARVLSQAESFHDLQVKNYYLSLLTEQDTEVIDRLETTSAQLLEAQQRLSEQLSALATAEAELRKNRTNLLATEDELERIIAGLESTRAGQLAQRQSLIEAQNEIESTLGDLDRQLEVEITRLRQEEQRLLRQMQEAYLDELKQEQLRQQAAALGRRIDNLTAPLTAAPSGYVYPVADHTIVSRYGQDNNSYMGLRAATAYAPVVAVQEGVVRLVSFVSANDGYMVSIAHTDTLSTVYTNLRPPVVEVGDRVSKGQMLGYLGGSTLVAPDTLKLWVQVTENGRSAFVDPATALGF
jgi:murein DD-endopeptidase MepM/ murein hydrolase activator NlpD